MSESLSVKRFFQSHHITLSDYWLESCIQWYQEENPNVNYSIETLNSAVYEQWLLLDLRDVEVPILPPNLAQQKKISLNNVYCLQLLYVQDISQPKLSQLQKIRTPNVLVDSSITDQEPKFYTGSKRMLQMVLTDGVQQIEAIEYKPIPLLKANIKPGSKIKITGPVQGVKLRKY
uniref:RecQ-mediated genome instability protein 1 n=1 Tax=Photinus pyralis TaxID=7054 RepID=A0A1Y1MFN2_PHOPY